MSRKNVIVDKTVEFTLSVIEIYNHLKTKEREFIISKQLMRSASAIGALVYEGQEAESRKDFIHKMTVALKEARETEYWFLIIKKGKYISPDRLNKASNQLQVILKILVKIVKTSKTNY